MLSEITQIKPSNWIAEVLGNAGSVGRDDKIVVPSVSAGQSCLSTYSVILITPLSGGQKEMLCCLGFPFCHDCI